MVPKLRLHFTIPAQLLRKMIPQATGSIKSAARPACSVQEPWLRSRSIRNPNISYRKFDAWGRQVGMPTESGPFFRHAILLRSCARVSVVLGRQVGMSIESGKASRSGD